MDNYTSIIICRITIEHTLVVRFDEQDNAPLICSLSKMRDSDINKAPYGRNCNREVANRILPYHMTLFHWDRVKNAANSEKVKQIKHFPCEVSITEIHYMPAEEDILSGNVNMN